jgi:hypothetical protein
VSYLLGSLPKMDMSASRNAARSILLDCHA